MDLGQPVTMALPVLQFATVTLMVTNVARTVDGVEAKVPIVPVKVALISHFKLTLNPINPKTSYYTNEMCYCNRTRATANTTG